MVNLLEKTHNLNTTKPIIYKAKIHWISYVLPILSITIGSIGILPVFILKGLLQFFAFLLIILFCRGIISVLKNKTTSIILSESMVTISTGILSKSISDISLHKMEGMHLHQSLIGNLLGYGSLTVSTGEVNQTFFISKPMELRKAIIENS